MAAGKPVVGFRGGGVAETVIDGETGVLFEAQNAGAMAEAIERLDGIALSPTVIRERAQAFDTGVFHARWRALLGRLGVDPFLYSAR
jgi:glycosyltransferase involved in cell wall biosynthesis